MMMLMSIAMSITFMFLNHPLSFGFILLTQTIVVSLLTGFLHLNYWYSYILFLIMIGGMLVLFIYMTSVASNEKFKFSPFLVILISSFFIITLLSFLIDGTLTNLFSSNYDLMNQNYHFNFKISMNKYLNWPMNYIFFMMIIYLLITLIMVVKITDIQYGPLRQKF
uniref:NADH-ubiquinone oxidoreductase chain 6 n=1 Tax=Cerambycidae sp. 3 KM-2017 TaxID=2219288 RepID=A0A346RFH4_9CUCU|nr:NADH dehydrogenase subunit 6 [Cerambycidae sp. 3 KM-2017]